MKVAHLITSLGLGGAERQLNALVGSEKDSDIQHIVISLQDEGELGSKILSHGVPLYCLNLHKSWNGFWKLFKILRQEKPAILQTWLYHADLIGFIVGKIARVPRIVWNLRCSNMILSQYSILTRLVVKILRALSQFPDAIVTNSQAGQTFHTELGYRPRQWIYIPNGIDTDYFKPSAVYRKNLRESLDIPRDAVVVGMLSRVDPMKDYETFLTAVDTLSDDYENLFCLVAGKGTKDASWKTVPPRFLRLGIYENVPEFLNSLDIMVLSSAFGEGFPNVVGEAMACEIPVIVTDVGDAALLVKTSTQIVPPQDNYKLILALKGLLALSFQERKAIGKESRTAILNLYSVSRMRQRYTSFYKDLVLKEKS